MNFLEKIGLAALPLGVLSIFVFPWMITVVLMAVASLTLPPSALFLGALLDVFYYPGIGIPVGVTYGLLLMAVGWGVRHVLKTRILR